MSNVYLDNNATTAVSPEVAFEIHRSLQSDYANPSSIHGVGQSAEKQLLAARKSIAETLNCLPEEIIFTASGSEANNLAITGYLLANQQKGKHIIISPIEHPSVNQAVFSLAKYGYEVTVLRVDSQGFIDPEDLKRELRPDTALISIMAANNEIGTIQPIEELYSIAREAKIMFHSDLVQAYGKMLVNFDSSFFDLASFSGHKIHAPKGIGFMYRKKGIELSPLIRGGSQEFGLRAGTENIHYISGLARAVRNFSYEDCILMKKLQTYLIEYLSQMPNVRINGPMSLDKRICSNVNFSVEHFEGELILKKLSSLGIYVSTGSACSSKSTKVSPVLRAIKCPVNYIHGNIRVGLSKYTTLMDIDIFLENLKSIVSSNKNNHIITNVNEGINL